VVELRRDTSGATTVFDVAKGFLTIHSMDHKKLQKLCYYAYAWHLGLYNRRLFNERFQASQRVWPLDGRDQGHRGPGHHRMEQGHPRTKPE
jgi:hypothetical protein